MRMPRLVVSGLSGGSGKTTFSLGLTRELTRRGFAVAPFKKGPDYIDTAWLALAAGRRAANLDPFFFPPDRIRAHFAGRFSGADVAVVEGNRGFFDGRDLSGSSSTAAVAAALEAPVVLVLDITKMTRTAAALVAGCKNFPGGGRIAGVVLNRSGSARHAAIAGRAVEELAGVRVFGVLPRLDSAPIYERRAGLVRVGAHPDAEKTVNGIADIIRDAVDVDAVLDTAEKALPLPGFAAEETPRAEEGPPVRIGVVRDDVLWQYYDENLDALKNAGAELVFVSLLDEAAWPEMDGLYLGGGDLGPYAADLSRNTAKKREIASYVAAGMPVYAEHSGYVYLGRVFSHAGSAYEMAGIFPVRASVTEKPARLGYMEARLTGDTLFYPEGRAFKGHEYHYADIAVEEGCAAFLRKTAGGRTVDVPDGLVCNGAFGTSMQIFAPSVPGWAVSFVRAARAWKKRTAPGQAGDSPI